MRFDLARTDTICALATAPVPSALAVIRVSGPNADAIRARVFVPRRGRQRMATATLGDVVVDNTILDEVLCTAFAAGKSFTGEASFELSLHGGQVIVKNTLKALVGAGCRIAEPGEFTLRAVLNGRMTLDQAEAVDDVIHARSLSALTAAQRALHGGLSEALAPVRTAIVDILSELEARLDFPDEEIGQAQQQQIASLFDRAILAVSQILKHADRSDRLRRGARVVLYGVPNAGKSTLLNALLDEDRALVHHEAGTTRDVLEAALDIDGVEVTLVDVAGIRTDATSAVEQLGIARAKREFDKAQVIVHLLPPDEDTAALDVVVRDDQILLRVQTKTDLSSSQHREADLAVSAKTGDGTQALKQRLADVLKTQHDGDETLLLRERHIDALTHAREALLHGRQAWQGGAFHELVASETRRAAQALDAIEGKDVNVDVLDTIFSRFCIGK